MTFKELQTIHKEIQSLTESKSLFEAIRKLKILLRSHKLSELASKLEMLESSYKSMLDFFAQGYKDPNGEQFCNNLQLEILKINDRSVFDILQPGYTNPFYTKSRAVKGKYGSLIQITDELGGKTNNLDIMRMLPANEQDKNTIAQLCKERETLIEDLFDYIWTSPELTESEIGVIKKVLSANESPIFVRKLIISALYLSVISFYDEEKIKILAELYNSENRELSVRALIAVYAISYVYEYRISISDKLKQILEMMTLNGHYNSDIKMIMLQHIKSLNTERINKKMNEELIPELMKISPDIYRQLKNKHFSIEESIDANPEWNKFMDNSDVTSKLQELNELQIEGGDVFMSTFSHMKSYGFFTHVSNWFLTYYSDNANIYDEHKAKILESIDKSYYLCDNDKYSFALTLQMLPTAESEIMLSQINEQNIGIKELKLSELNTDNSRTEKEVRSNIQDLYRFYKLNNKTLQYPDLFDFIPFINKSPLIKESQDTENIIFDFLVKNNYYPEAIKILTSKISRGELDAREYEKLGFCYQNIKEYSKALDCYKKAEFLEAENLWLMKHIAQCYKNCGDLSTAEQYYLKVLSSSPDNISLLNILGNINFEQNELQKSLDYYYKAEYLSDGNSKFWRPIAWVEFLLGNYEKSKCYYDKIITNDTPTATDYLNIGHYYWVTDNISEAVKYYALSYKAYGNDYNTFKSDFKHDLKVLIEKGVEVSLFDEIIDKSCYNATL